MSCNHRGIAILVCALALFSVGCKKRKVLAAPPTSTPPAASEPATKPSEAPAETKPDSTRVPAPPPALVVPPPRKRPPARPAPETPPPTEPLGPQPAPPQISPRLSAAEHAQYQRETTEAIAAAEKDLQSLSGKRVTANERDLIEKIRGFLAQAHEAMAASDWLRARTLAQKARVLSAELVGRR